MQVVGFVCFDTELPSQGNIITIMRRGAAAACRLNHSNAIAPDVVSPTETSNLCALASVMIYIITRSRAVVHSGEKFFKAIGHQS